MLFTVALIIVAIFLIGAAAVSFFLGKRMTAERLDILSEALEKFVETQKVVATKNERDIIRFDDNFKKQVGLNSLMFVVGGKGGFIAQWNNGRMTHYVPRTSTDAEAMLRFVKALKKGIDTEDIDAAAGTDQIEAEIAAEKAKEVKNEGSAE